jgi:hypothetical protein
VSPESTSVPTRVTVFAASSFVVCALTVASVGVALVDPPPPQLEINKPNIMIDVILLNSIFLHSLVIHINSLFYT